ncbi:hypothetical protein ACWGIB_23725 [Streptomyces xiamenensis]
MATMTVARHNLSVSAAETIRVTMRQFDTRRGALWGDLLHFLARHDRAVFIMDSDRVLGRDEVAPGGVVPADVLEMPWRASSSDAVACLTSAGYLAGRPTVVRHDAAHDTYLDTGRAFEAVSVRKPFKVVTVAYRHGDGQPGHDWTLAGVLGVPAGTYVIASTGDVRMTIRAIGYTQQASVLSGPGVSRAQAECRTCGGRWRAKDGSWRFRPERLSDASWSYDAAEDHRDGTIACPAHACAGRVGFRIF